MTERLSQTQGHGTPPLSPSLIDDGFATTLVLDCGCTRRVHNGDPRRFDVPFKVGDRLSCPRHSVAVGKDPATDENLLDRDRHITEVRDES